MIAVVCAPSLQKARKRNRPILCLALLALCFPRTFVVASPEDEFIRVAADRWSFETQQTRTRFVPFGTNFVLSEKKYLNLFAPDVYDAERYDRALAALEKLGFNLVKVFLPIAKVLPDPQTPGAARIAPGYLDNLDDFLRRARQHHIRVEVSLASWGGNGIKWWHEGGEYFGRKPWRTDDGIDSLDVLVHFWTILCTRFRDNPTLFSYTPAVEWSFPAGNLTWTPPNKQYGRLETEQGLFYWRAFLRARYDDDIAALNKQYGTHYRTFSQVSLVDFSYDFQTKKYADPEAKILDYQNFREWASRRYFKPQIAAIRAADPNHLVTISNHSRRAIGLWPGAARYFIGLSVPEETDLVDYFTTHDNNDETKLKPGQTIDDVVRACVLRCRFCNASATKPLIIEEFTFASADPQTVARGQAKMVLGTIGSASGWMNWYLQAPHKPNSADTSAGTRSAILNDDFTPTPWGLQAHELIRTLQHADLARTPAGTTLTLDRRKELVPHTMGTLLTILQHWNQYNHPVDFRWPRNKWIDMKLLDER